MVRLKQLLVKLTRDERASGELSVATKPAQSCQPCLASNEQEEGVQVADEIDLNSPICTSPDDFKLFEKRASTPQFKTVVETYEPQANPLF
jgi:UDP-N-acetylmuramoylalanine-D-glutamate ligase